jgi:hypothetical protein
MNGETSRVRETRRRTLHLVEKDDVPRTWPCSVPACVGEGTVDLAGAACPLCPDHEREWLAQQVGWQS